MNEPVDASHRPFAACHRLEDVDPPIPMLILERELTIRWISTAAVKELGLRTDLLVGRSWYDLFPESRARRSDHDALFRGELARLDLPRIRLTLGCGSRYFSLRLRPLKSADGSVEAIVGVGEDITAQVEAELSQRESEERFRAMSTHARDMVVISSKDGTVTFESEAVERILGPRLTPRPVISIFDNVHPDDLVRTREIFERLVADPAVGVLHDIELRKRHEDGSWRWLQFTATNLLDLPAVRGIVLNGRDVSDRKRIETQLRHNELQLATAMWASQTAYWSANVQTDTLEMSDRFFEMTGIDRAEWDAAVEPWCTWVHADDAPMGCARYRAHLAGRTPEFEHEYRMRTPKGWMWLLDRGKVVERDSDGNPVRMAGVTTDISSRKSLERKIVEAVNRQQRRLSHELHDGLAQQLTGIALLLETALARRRQLTPDGASDLDAIALQLRKAVLEIQTLVQELLPASIQRGDLGPALHALARQVTSSFGMTVDCVTDDTFWQQLTDEAAQLLYQIVQHSLSLARRHRGAMAATVSLRRVGAELNLMIADNGSRFDPDRSVPAGLALRQLAERAQMLGGDITVEHASDGGTSVSVRCPLPQSTEHNVSIVTT